MSVSMVRIVLPAPLRLLANTPCELWLEVDSPVTQRTLLDAVEAAHPTLAGTLRDRTTGERRPFIRFFACGQDRSLDSPDHPLPSCILDGREPFLIVAAVAGG